jgi:hypothetical protein
MTEAQYKRFLKNQQMDGTDEDSRSFQNECETYRVAGGYDSAKVVGAAGY